MSVFTTSSVVTYERMKYVSQTFKVYFNISAMAYGVIMCVVDGCFVSQTRS